MTRATLACLAAAACASGPPNPELLGDRAYAAGRYAEAAAAYGAALRRDAGVRLWGKSAAAALRGGSLDAAESAFERVGIEDPSRADEAANGMEQVARAADDAGNLPVLARAVLAIRRLAPERRIGRYALVAARDGHLSAADAISILPQALAATDDPRSIDSLLARYGEALGETAACDESVQALAAVVRRTADPALRQRARAGIGACALRLGQGSLAAGGSSDDSLSHLAAARLHALGMPLQPAEDSIRSSHP